MYYQLDAIFGQKIWHFNKYLGATYSKPFKDELSLQNLPQEIQDPFIIHRRLGNVEQVHISFCMRCYVDVLIFAAKKFYPLAYLLSFLCLNIYKNAQQASWAFRQITKDKQQRLLCLPRSIFIATTSKRFKEHGTMYIGVFLPSRNMHAWVIEDCLQTDEMDAYWIMYRPLIMMKK